MIEIFLTRVIYAAAIVADVATVAFRFISYLPVQLYRLYECKAIQKELGRNMYDLEFYPAPNTPPYKKKTFIDWFHTQVEDKPYQLDATWTETNEKGEKKFTLDKLSKVVWLRTLRPEITRTNSPNSLAEPYFNDYEYLFSRTFPNSSQKLIGEGFLP